MYPAIKFFGLTGAALSVLFSMLVFTFILIDRVKKLLQSTAELQFWEVYTNQETAQFFISADVLLAEIIKPAEQEQEVDVDSTVIAENEIDELLESLESDEKELIVLNIPDPDRIRELAITITSEILNRRKREFKLSPFILFVFDEAQEFIKARGKTEELECSEAIEDLARHGRKYGLGVCISTQRIAHLNTNVLQQLHTYFVGTLPRPYDRSLISDVCTIEKDILDKTLEFGKGEWLVSSHSATGMPNVPIFIKSDNTEYVLLKFLES